MTSTLRNPLLTIAAFATLLLVALVAFTTCGDDDGDEVTARGTGSPSPTSSMTPTSEVTDVPATAPPFTDAPAVTDPPGEPTEPPDGNGGNGAPPPSDVTLLTPVDKQHALPPDYAPSDLASIPAAYLAPGSGAALRVEARDALVAMLDVAFVAGHDIGVVSAFRSYSEQEATFQYWVDTLGYDEAVRVSAMPGHSEHQLGTTADVSTAEVGWGLTESFGDTGAGQWLAANAHLYGFALSYPAGAEGATGYAYEPWHFRYIGPGEAAAWKSSGLTLNVYLLD
jgi:D-alanyl-D-alanine carboxypeptidase